MRSDPTIFAPNNDTIAAIATAPGEAGLAVVRISGPKALSVAESTFIACRKHSEPQTAYTARYGAIVDKNGNKIDDVVLLVMHAPHSYTGEDTAEISCHGGSTVTAMVLNTVLQYGIRLANPGEFTMRAFLNGRMDLVQAEAVADLIHARTNAAVQSARRQLDGGLSRVCSELRSDIVGVLAAVEVTIDYSDEVPELDREIISADISAIIDKLRMLLNGALQGRMVREGLNVVILGKPNVGKSSLLNRLLGYERAIVTDTAGTTRDILQEAANIHGVPVTLVDTAGLRDTVDIVEQQGVQRAESAAAMADTILAVADAKTGVTSEDERALRTAQQAGVRVLAVVNRCDLASDSQAAAVAAQLEQLLGTTGPALKVSAHTGEGLPLLQQAIAPRSESIEAVGITRLRHETACSRAIESLQRAVMSTNSLMPADFITIDLHEAVDALAEITGEGAPDELIHRIFKDFCVGK